MLNKIWFGLLLVGILYGFGKATFNSITLATMLRLIARQQRAQTAAGPS